MQRQKMWFPAHVSRWNIILVDKQLLTYKIDTHDELSFVSCFSWCFCHRAHRSILSERLRNRRWLLAVSSTIARRLRCTHRWLGACVSLAGIYWRWMVCCNLLAWGGHGALWPASVIVRVTWRTTKAVGLRIHRGLGEAGGGRIWRRGSGRSSVGCNNRRLNVALSL